RLESAILAYVLDLVRATREDASIDHGGSTRAADALCVAVRAKAALAGRDYALPDDVKALFRPALRHRVVLSPAAEIDGLTTDDALARITDQVAAPR
ncbi:MAG: MoxR family ATPase, partial [Pseudomonadota bacterium]